MGFKFRYEALLSYRQHLKEKAEIELALAQRRLRQCRELLVEYQEDLSLTNRTFTGNLKKKIHSGVLINHIYYVVALNRRIENQKIEITESEKVVREKLDILLTKTKQFKIFERLKEKDFQKWNQRQHQIEQKAISEAALLRYGREFPSG